MNGVRVRRKGPAVKDPDGNAVESYAYNAAGRLVREVARYLAAEGNLKPDDVMAWLIENDSIDFLTKGAESMGKQRLLGRKVIPMAARAVSFYYSPDTAVMFKGPKPSH